MSKENDKRLVIGKILNVILAIATISIISICGYVILVEKNEKIKTGENRGSDKYLEQIKEAMDLVREKYYGEIDEEALVEGAIEGIMDSIDDIYTRYVDKEEFSEMVQGTSKTYTGLGVHITYDAETEGVLISNVMPNSPAEKQGLLPGDIFLKVNDTYSSSKTYYDIIDTMKNEEPTTLHIIYLRDGEVLEGDFTTEIVIPNPVSKDILEGNIGYIRIFSFDVGTSTEFFKCYDEIMKSNLKGLIIDLRNNPGGVVDEACDILKKLCPEGILVKMVDKDGTERVISNSENNKLDIPLVVLVNGSSASASEIFSGAIKDLEAGTVVGTKTYGKGIVQSVQKLRLSEGAVSVTTSKYYTASGVEIHKNGIEPNVTVEQSEKYSKKWYVPVEEDMQLKRAIEIINETKK
ncbi:MAG: S41 family peptidase [Clostridia bacterium]|nr:S41 family peptidase [Clostridia bacterium]